MAPRPHTREDSGIRLDAEGCFWHDRERVEHPKVALAFHRGIERGPDGRYLLRFGDDWCFIQVEDAAYQVLVARPEGEALCATLDDRTEERLSPGALSVSDAGVLYARVKRGAMEARFSRAAQAQLAGQLTEANGRFALRLGGKVAVLPDRQRAALSPEKWVR